MVNIETLKQDYFKTLDKEAFEIAEQVSKDLQVTELILDLLKKMYLASNTEKTLFNQPGIFECAYHSPVTSDFEFFIARMLYHYSKINDLNWKVYLRRQSKNNGKLLAPDIRIEKDEKTLFIVEIKVKVGWIQYLFSEERSEHDKSRGFEVEKKIAIERERINFLLGGFEGLHKENIYYLIPSLKEAYRRKYDKEINDYKDHFARTLNLDCDQIILLSNSPKLNLDKPESVKASDYEPTNLFEGMFKKIRKISKK